MSTQYPNQIDGNTELPQAVDLRTPVNALAVNNLRGAIIAIEQELGIDPSREYGTVRARLDAMQDEINSLIAGGGGAVSVKLDGTTIVSAATSLNFEGSGVTVTALGNQANITITGGGGSGTIQVIQENQTVGTNGQTAFTLSFTPDDDSAVMMFFNGVKQDYASDYTVSGTSVTYIGSPSLITTDLIEFWYVTNNTTASISQEQESFVPSNGQTAFVLSQTPDDVTTVMMFVNGIKQDYGTDYTGIGSTITFAYGTLTTSDLVEFWYIFSGTGSAAYYQTVQDPSGTTVNQRPTIQFIGAGVSSVVDDGGNNKTVVTISGGGGSQDLQDVLDQGNSATEDINLTGTLNATDGYFSNDLHIAGKLTVDGLIDPTGLVLTEQATKPAAGTSTTGVIWVRNDNELIFTDQTNTDNVLGAAPPTSNWAAVLSAGNTSGGTNPTLSAGDVLTAAVGENVIIQSANHTTAGNVILNGGVSSTGSGGDINLNTGAGASGQQSGSISLSIANATGGNTAGGGISLNSGQSIGSGAGGFIGLSAGNASAGGVGGAINLYAGLSALGVGGAIAIEAGNGQTDGGDITIISGSGVSGAAGDVSITVVNSVTPGTLSLTNAANGTLASLSTSGILLDYPSANNSILINSSTITLEAATYINVSATGFTTPNTTGANSNNLTIKSGNATSAGFKSGNVTIQSGTVVAYSGGPTVETGDIAILSPANGGGNGQTGSISLTTGDGNAGSSGTIALLTGQGQTGSSGNISITTGPGGGGAAGSITLTSGAGSSSASGAISLITGSSGGQAGGDLALTTGTSSANNGGMLNITLGTSGAGNGGALTVYGGNASGSGGGGGATYYLGTSSSGSGGGFYIYGGNSSSGPGGTFQYTAGDSVSGTGGAINLYAGDSGGGAGGQIQIVAGHATDNDNNGGIILLEAGDADGSGTGGNVDLTAGDGDTSGPGGAVYLRGGGSNNDNGGSINLYGGVTNIGNGGGINISAANTNTGDGGTVTIQAGGTSSGNGGNVSIYSGTGTPDGVIILDGLTWPLSDGAPGEFITTDGSGNLSWASAGGGSDGYLILEEESVSPITGNSTTGGIWLGDDGYGYLINQDNVSRAIQTTKQNVQITSSTTINASYSDFNTGKVYVTSSGSAIAFNIPGNIGLLAGDTITVVANGSGQITFAGTNGMTINGRGGALLSAGQYAVMSVIITSSTTGILIGDITT